MKNSARTSNFLKYFAAIVTAIFLMSPLTNYSQGFSCGVTQITSSNLGFGSSGTSAGSFSAMSGKRIVFSSDGDLAGNNPDRNGELFFYDEGVGFTQITHTTTVGGFGGGNGTISSNGKRVVFISYEDLVGNNPDGNDELFLYDADSDAITQITDTTSFGWLGIGVISPNGNKVAFNSERDFTGQNADGGMEIFTYDIASGLFTQVTNTIGKANGLWSISSDGSRLAIASNADLVPNFNIDGNFEVFVYDANSGFIQVSITFDPSVFNNSAFISEDGLHVAYTSNNKYLSNADGNNELFIFDLANSALSQVTNTTGNTQIQTASISGDGNRVVFISNRNLTGINSDANDEIFLYDRNSGSIVQVSDTQAPVPNYRAEISSDGKRVFWDSSGYPSGNADGSREMFMAECVPPPSADLLVGLSADQLSVKQGEKVTYTITVNNNGPNDAVGLIVNDILSSGSTFVSAQVNKGSFTAPSPGQTGTVTWYPGNLANGTSSSAQIKVTVIAKGKTSITNTVNVSAVTADPNLANNAAAIATTIASGTGGGKK